MAQKTTLRPHGLPGGLRTYTAKAEAGAVTAISIFGTPGTAPNHATDDGGSLLLQGGFEAQYGAWIGGAVNYYKVNSIGNVTFAGSAGFYPRILAQDGEPGAGTGATQIDSGELIMWIDTNDSNKSYFMYNYGGAVTKIELV